LLSRRPEYFEQLKSMIMPGPLSLASEKIWLYHLHQRRIVGHRTPDMHQQAVDGPPDHLGMQCVVHLDRCWHSDDDPRTSATSSLPLGGHTVAQIICALGGAGIGWGAAVAALQRGLDATRQCRPALSPMTNIPSSAPMHALSKLPLRLSPPRRPAKKL
jgi:hypothetical protein